MTKVKTAPESWRTVRTTGFMNLMGPLLRSASPDNRNTFGLQTDNRHGNHIGIIHGGVLTSLLDQAIAITAWNMADQQPIVTVQMDTRFLGSARIGDFLEARVSVRHATRSLIFADADITCGPKQVANASAIMKISSNTGKFQ